MKKVLIVALIVLVAVTCVFALVGCDNRPVLKVATNAFFPPFESYDESMNFVGIDMDLAREIGDRLGYKVVIENMEFDSVISSVQAGTHNIGMAGLTVTEARKEQVLFCDEYYTSAQVVIARKGDPILSLTDPDDILEMLKNKKIGVQRGTTGNMFVAGDEDFGYDGIEGAEAVVHPSGATAMLDLKNSTVDYVIIDDAPAAKLVEANSSFAAYNTIKLTEEAYAFAVNKQATELQAKVNETLRVMIEDGTFQRIINKHFGVAA